MSDMTGQVLMDNWESRNRHDYPDACPVCGAAVSTAAITNLVYTFEVCTCGEPDYDHLIETLWHRACFTPQTCTTFRPFRVRGVRGRPAHFTATCHVCGRLEDAHGRP